MPPPTAPSTVVGDVPELSQMERRGQLEVDTFCLGCHYNLHGQAVTIDPRLNLPICRCPECGRFHPAGTGVTATNVWGRRFATVLLFHWVAIVLATALAVCFFLALLSAGTVSIYTYPVQVDPDGNELVYHSPTMTTTPNGTTSTGPAAGFYIKGTNTPAKSTVYAMKLHPIYPPPAPPEQADDSNLPYWERYRSGPGPTPFYWLSAGSAALGGLAGVLIVTLLWHWPRRRYAWCVLLPLLSAAVLLTIYITGEEFTLIRTGVITRAALQLAIQCGGILVGVLVGRPVARAIARTIIPPKPRQALAFLWQVDGKPLPGVPAKP